MPASALPPTARAPASRTVVPVPVVARGREGVYSKGGREVQAEGQQAKAGASIDISESTHARASANSTIRACFVEVAGERFVKCYADRNRVTLLAAVDLQACDMDFPSAASACAGTSAQQSVLHVVISLADGAVLRLLPQSPRRGSSAAAHDRRLSRKKKQWQQFLQLCRARRQHGQNRQDSATHSRTGAAHDRSNCRDNANGAKRCNAQVLLLQRIRFRCLMQVVASESAMRTQAALHNMQNYGPEQALLRLKMCSPTAPRRCPPASVPVPVPDAPEPSLNDGGTRAVALQTASHSYFV